MEKNKELQVRSFNDWENSDLSGDASRKQKFLKLMGSGKKQDSVKNSSIGENKPSFGQHARSREESEKIDNDLSKQYQTSLMHSLTGSARQHVGLGFQATKKNGIDVNKANPNKVVFDSDSDNEKAESSEGSHDKTAQQTDTKTSANEQLSNCHDDEHTERTKAEKKAAKKLKKQKANELKDNEPACDSDTEKNVKKKEHDKRNKTEPDASRAANNDLDDEIPSLSKAERKAAKKLKKAQAEMLQEENTEQAGVEEKTGSDKAKKRKSNMSEYSVESETAKVKRSKAENDADSEHLKTKKKSKKHKSEKRHSEDS